MTVAYATTWDVLQDTFERVASDVGEPIILSSLPYMPTGEHRHTSFPLVLGPPGRLVAIAIGLRAALPTTPIIIVGAADAVTLGTNHLIHAARRNIGMTLVLLRSDVLTDAIDRAGWSGTGYQSEMEQTASPLEWATALSASLVARGSITNPSQLAAVVTEAARTAGFSVIGVTSDAGLPLGVLSTNPWPEFLSSYREWAAPLRRDDAKPPTAPSTRRAGAPRRVEVRIAGFGGQGVKLAGTILSEAAGLGEGLWATHYGEYGAATRGGPSKVDVVMGSERITYAGADHPDVLVALSQGAADAHLAAAPSGARLVADADGVDPIPPGVIAVPVSRLAREHTGKPIAAGVTSLGCVAALTDVVSLENLRDAVRKRVPGRSMESNLAAMEAAYEYTRETIGG
ncbi:MAG: 2-oxoacid:acceptor oxidoreductase family protein [Acidimicrobiia bacterium]|nr:2-oxoacid:acceptor oxidoreductase family protein [Acidimicrobiia bacterium]